MDSSLYAMALNLMIMLRPLIIISIFINYFVLLFFMREKKLGKRPNKIDIQIKAIMELRTLTLGSIAFYLITICFEIWYNYRYT